MRLGRKSRLDQALVRFLNRLSDALFVLARWMAKQQSEPEFLVNGTRRACELCPSSPVSLEDVGDLARQGLLMVGRVRPIEKYILIRICRTETRPA